MFIDEDGIERCCRRWHKDFCDCVSKAHKAYRKRKAATNKIPFGPHKGTAYFSLTSVYLKSILAEGISNKEVEAKVIEVLESRNCEFSVGQRGPDDATERQREYINGLERRLGIPPGERTVTSNLTKQQACQLIADLKSRPILA